MHIRRIKFQLILAPILLFSAPFSKCNDDACQSLNFFSYKNIAIGGLVAINLLLYKYENNLRKCDLDKLKIEARDHAKESHVPDPIYWALSDGIKTSIKGFRYISGIGLSWIAYDNASDYYACKQRQTH